MGEDFNFNIVVVIVFLIMGAMRWVLENVNKSKKQNPRHPQSDSRYEEFSGYPTQRSDSLEDLYEETRREILERQNRHIPKPEVIAEKLNKYRTPPTAPPPLPTKTQVQEPLVEAISFRASSLPEVQRPSLSQEEQKALASFQENSSSRTKKSVRATSEKSRVRELLASPSASRDAIVLAEILNPPKGLR